MDVSSGLLRALSFYRVYFFGAFDFALSRFEINMMENVYMLSSLTDRISISYQDRLMLYDAQMLIMLIHRTESKECKSLLNYFEEGNVSYLYGLDIDWSLMPQKVFQMYTMHVSRLLYMYEPGLNACVGVWDDFDRHARVFRCMLYGASNHVDRVLLSGVYLNGFHMDSTVSFGVCDMLARHRLWMLSIVKRLCEVNDRELNQRGQLLISLSDVQRKHIASMQKKELDEFVFRPPSFMNDNVLKVSLNGYVNFMMRMKDAYTGVLGFCSGFMLIWSALPHEWLFGSTLSVKDHRRWLMYMPCMYKHVFVREGCFYTYDKRISWGKKYYGCTVFYYSIMKKKYGCYNEYFSGLRHKILNEFL